MITIARSYRRLALAAALAALAVPLRVGAQAPASPGALLWHVVPNGQAVPATRDRDAAGRSSCATGVAVSGGPAAGALAPAGTHVASLLAAAVTRSQCGGRSVAFSARGEASTWIAPLQLGAWRTSAAVAFPTATGSVWLAYGRAAVPVERRSSGIADSARLERVGSVLDRDMLQELSLGTSRRIGAMTLSVAAGGARAVVHEEVATPGRTVIDSVWNDTSGWVRGAHQVGGGSAARALVTRWMTGEVNASWMRERVAASATLGGWMPRANSRAIGWGAVELARRIQPGVWLVAATGVRPDASRRGSPTSHYALVGLRLSYAPRTKRTGATRPDGTARTFAITPAGAGSYTIALRAPSAKRAEISGDFTGWQAMALVRGANGWWIATVRLAPGAYRVNVRIDGGSWRAPPGTTVVEDDFGGSAGLLVVPE